MAGSKHRSAGDPGLKQRAERARKHEYRALCRNMEFAYTGDDQTLASLSTAIEAVLVLDETNPQAKSEISATDDDDTEDELLLKVDGDNDKYPPAGWDLQQLRRLVAWQMERHIQWAGSNPPWKSKAEPYATLDMRSASELRRGKPYGRGNLGLNKNYCRVDPGESKWGLPYEAYLADVTRTRWTPKPREWMSLDGPRVALIALENWFFALSDAKRAELPRDYWQWETPTYVNLKWNAASGVIP
ncbi:uncharacterized protein N7459_009253 [Penicillium hispanicum]|uniref:uncharacterized protein n=1 Tax=Penicillium hispanicum TaxID=1080232 RepID=UPI0025418255|nr:uncharacterized protein N7459_009253 [Penicillium hispanicum]KAJ5569823.1 hypothetical protein N7459_009253 [Penicillium hispanicum]